MGLGRNKKNSILVWKKNSDKKLTAPKLLTTNTVKTWYSPQGKHKELGWEKRQETGVLQKTKVREPPHRARSADYPLRGAGHKLVCIKLYASAFHLNLISLDLASLSLRSVPLSARQELGQWNAVIPQQWCGLPRGLLIFQLFHLSVLRSFFDVCSWHQVYDLLYHRRQAMAHSSSVARGFILLANCHVCVYNLSLWQYKKYPTVPP